MGFFFAVDRNLLSNPKTFSLEPVVLACKKLLQFEQVFLRENFCENVAEIAKCSNYGFEIKSKSRFNAKNRQRLLVQLLRKPNLQLEREKLNIREKCGYRLNFKTIIGTFRDFGNIFAEVFP